MRAARATRRGCSTAARASTSWELRPVAGRQSRTDRKLPAGRIPQPRTSVRVRSMAEEPDRRVHPPHQGGERETLESFLDFYRETILVKLEGLSDEDLGRVIVPSGWSPLGMVKHLAYVERSWFRTRLAGEPAGPVPWTKEDPDADFRIEPGETNEDILGFYREECAHSREVAAKA